MTKKQPKKHVVELNGLKITVDLSGIKFVMPTQQEMDRYDAMVERRKRRRNR